MKFLPFSLRKLFLSWAWVFLFLSIPTVAHAQADNPCETNLHRTQSVAITISTAATTRIIANAATDQSIAVCSVYLTLVGGATANTVIFEYGSGGTCGTGTTALTGPFTSANTAGAIVPILISDSPFQVLPVAKELCVVTTQALGVGGVVTYVIY